MNIQDVYIDVIHDIQVAHLLEFLKYSPIKEPFDAIFLLECYGGRVCRKLITIAQQNKNMKQKMLCKWWWV